MIDHPIATATDPDGGDTYNPGQQPDEVTPDQGDTVTPGQVPDEIQPGQGDFDRPDSAPPEIPALPINPD